MYAFRVPGAGCADVTMCVLRESNAKWFAFVQCYSFIQLYNIFCSFHSPPAHYHLGYCHAIGDAEVPPTGAFTLRSGDGGSVWTIDDDIPGIPSNGLCPEPAIAAVNSTALVALVRNGGVGFLESWSHDGGTTLPNNASVLICVSQTLHCSGCVCTPSW